MDTLRVFEDWRKLSSVRSSRVELLRQALQHIPSSSVSFSEVLRQYQYYVDSIEDGANNFAEEVLKNGDDDGSGNSFHHFSCSTGTPEWRSTFDVKFILDHIKEEPLLDYGLPLADIHNITTSTAEQLKNIIDKVLRKAPELELVVRAPVRGGTLLNRKAQFAKISREPVMRESTSLFNVDTVPSAKVREVEPDSKCFCFLFKFGLCSSSVVFLTCKTPSSKSEEPAQCRPTFITARQQLLVNAQVQQSAQSGSAVSRSESTRKTLGGRGSRTAFVPPFTRSSNEVSQTAATDSSSSRQPNPLIPSSKMTPEDESDGLSDERLKQFDQKIIDLIMSEARRAFMIFIAQSDIFTGLRGPPKGLLLFGPPGTGKTLIGKCIASTSQSTFFSISASSLTSKWVGDGEKMVRALFTIARIHQPSVIFIDEIDSLLSQRSEMEHESSRRIKTEFLVQLDGVATGSEDRLLLIGATNRPQELDEAARRRFVKRLYIPLPCLQARREIVDRLIRQQKHSLTPDDLDTVAAKSEGFSGADVANLCREAAMGPIRGLPLEVIQSISCQDVPPVRMSDFLMAFKHVKASVSPSDLQHYLSWNQQYGSFQV
ncbi:unnamed protein product [Hydatigera taeniaeformis]|uniref:AAA domain-containing protein n=1 Tax=Hydatigena taeniaeformis TaxID=6205 RepID=A0A0R3X0F2_HYDTA|nr:unnamed protein product [Hydatigera taeniaeformis]